MSPPGDLRHSKAFVTDHWMGFRSIPPISGSGLKLIDGIVLSEPPRAASNSAFVHSLDNSKLILSIDKNFAKIARLP